MEGTRMTTRSSRRAPPLPVSPIKQGMMAQSCLGTELVFSDMSIGFRLLELSEALGGMRNGAQVKLFLSGIPMFYWSENSVLPVVSLFSAQ